MGTPNKYNPDMCEKAIEVLANGESLAAVCCELDITRETLRVWRETHTEFGEAIEKGLMKSQRVWERLGQEGIKGYYERFSSAPWIFTMKNRFRDDYKDDSKEQKPTSDSLVEKLIDKLID